jgi:hypothetical protein
MNCVYTRWFRYDRDKLWLVYTQIVLVTFEPPYIKIILKVESLKTELLKVYPPVPCGVVSSDCHTGLIANTDRVL